MPIEHIHPAIVHFPIVLMLLTLTLDAVAYGSGRALSRGTVFGNMSVASITAAGAFALLAFLFGDMAYDIAVQAGTPVSVLDTHEGLGTTTAFAIAGWAVLRLLAWWRVVKIEGGRSGVVAVVDVALVGMVIATAFYGGNLVYDHAVAVSHAALQG